jgi:hypothetical protein
MTEALLDSMTLSSSAWARNGLSVSQDGAWVSAAQVRRLRWHAKHAAHALAEVSWVKF